MNPAYTGTLEWGWRKSSKCRGSKEGAHEALVDGSLWRRAQDRLRAKGCRVRPWGAAAASRRCATLHSLGRRALLLRPDDSRGRRHPEGGDGGGAAPLAPLPRWRTGSRGRYDGVSQRRADIEARKARLLRLAEETDDPEASARIREPNADLKRLDAARASAPDPRALKAEAARRLAAVRGAFKVGRTADAAAINVELTALRPLIVEAIWDRDTRTAEPE